MNEFALTWIDLPVIIFSVLLGHYIIGVFVRKFPALLSRKLLVKLFYYHFFFCFIYCLYIFNFGGDAIGYWKFPFRFLKGGDSIFILHEPGSQFIHFVTYPFSQIIGLSLWGGTALFSLLGFLGFIYFHLTLRRILKVNPSFLGLKLFPLILFLPNMHFWSGGIGKDTIIFFALTLFVFCMTNVKGNILGLAISLYLAFFVRPHIALVMLGGLGCGLFLSSSGISTMMRISFLAVSLLVVFLISDTVFQFIGLEETSIESYEDVANIRSKNLSRASVGSAIDINSYSMPVKMFTFLYRPLFFDAGNLFGIVVSIENLFYLLLTLSACRWRTISEIVKMPMLLKASIVIVAVTTFFMSSSLSNLGIIIRQKNMVMFMLLLVTVYLISVFQSVGRKMRPRISASSPAASRMSS